MQPHQQRVVEEKADLDVKVAALQKFIKQSPHFDTLDIGEQWRLTTQAHIMVQYSAILGERIAAFTE
jgi:hypothetical protein